LGIHVHSQSSQDFAAHDYPYPEKTSKIFKVILATKCIKQLEEANTNPH
jgi:hypothetical protein